MAELDPTQRAYTLRLQGQRREDYSWSDALWATHEAVNKGVKVFGDWLLTLRGGLDPGLAERPVKDKKGERPPEDKERKNRRILLALSWLSVESQQGAPEKYIVASGRDLTSERIEKVKTAFHEILKCKGLDENQIQAWTTDCLPSLSAAIREDAVWVNRNKAFEDAKRQYDITDEDVWDILEPFLGNVDAYFFIKDLPADDQDGSAEESSGGGEEPKDLVKQAGQWLSSRFGTGKGADFDRMSAVYEKMAELTSRLEGEMTSGAFFESLAKHLSEFNPDSSEPQAILKLVSGPGYKSATRNLIKKFAEQPTLNSDDLMNFTNAAREDARESRNKVGSKGQRNYADAILSSVERVCGFTYLTASDGSDVSVETRYQLPENYTWGTSRHKEFAVMLDHAARRVSIAHSWIKKAEARRNKFEADAQKIKDIHPDVKAYLDAYCESRASLVGSLEEYLIRPRAVSGWEEVVKAWAKLEKQPGWDNKEPDQRKQARVDVARELQDQIEKFGDIQLFESLASDDATLVWHKGGKADGEPDPELLKNYVKATVANFNKQRFKVPAYRHPDAYYHPVFCDFGNSRWDVRFSVHEAHTVLAEKKAQLERLQQEMQTTRNLTKKSKLQSQIKDLEEELRWLENPRLVQMKLWTGKSIAPVILRWQSKRLVQDLALNQNASTAPEVVSVSRADRLGRAAAGLSANHIVQVKNIFDEDHWNGRLQAPREQLEELARHVEKHGWDARAIKLRRSIQWLVTFSPKLEPWGPWCEYVNTHPDFKGLKTKNPSAWPHAEENKKRSGDARLILCRLPNLRVLSVDLGHRYAAACAVWETLSKEDFIKQTEGKKIKAGGTGSDSLYCHVEHECAGKKRTIIFRRIGSDTLPDGSEHPAPWARLDRQFFIKLQGEQEGAREASNEEIWQVHKLEKELGVNTPLIDRLVTTGWGETEGQQARLEDLRKRGWKPETSLGTTVDESAEEHDEEARFRPSLSVDDLMAYTVRSLRLALKRHGDRARIAFAMKGEYMDVPGGRKYYFREQRDASEGASSDERRKSYTEYLAKALQIWADLAYRVAYEPGKKCQNGAESASKEAASFDSKYSDPKAEELWTKYIAHLPEYEKLERFGGSKKRAETQKNNENRLKKLADALIDDVDRRMKIYDEFKAYWEEEDKRWSNRIKRVKRWLTGKGLGDTAESNSKHGRKVGGLSLTRIATLTEFRRKVQVGFYTRLRPDGSKKEIKEGFSQKLLNALEELREQRVKQLCSRIIEAALGVGSENVEHWEDTKKRPRGPLSAKDPRFAPCHAIVIENLEHYRPEEMRTRRENRQLMSWSAGHIRKLLKEETYLYGLHLREVSPSFTSRQDSRTGAAGIRCSDVTVREFLYSPRWRKRVLQARENGNEDVESEFLHMIDERLNDKQKHHTLSSVIRLPDRGGDIFVSSDPRSPAAGGIQADLNAAANIGLRALMDPDWPGKWWYVLCSASSFAPAQEKVKGSACMPPRLPVQWNESTDSQCGSTRRKDKNKGQQQESVNLWDDVNVAPLDQRQGWRHYTEYWNQVRSNVIRKCLYNWKPNIEILR